MDVNEFVRRLIDCGLLKVQDSDIFTRNHIWTPWHKRRGCLSINGYRKTTLCRWGYRKNVFFHRIIWIWNYGIPNKKLQIDHIDRNKDNNNILNLRLITPKVNSNNRKESIFNKRSSKINFDIAEEIRKLNKEQNKNAYELARIYKLSVKCVYNILYRKTYREREEVGNGKDS